MLLLSENQSENNINTLNMDAIDHLGENYNTNNLGLHRDQTYSQPYQYDNQPYNNHHHPQYPSQPYTTEGVVSQLHPTILQDVLSNQTSSKPNLT